MNIVQAGITAIILIQVWLMVAAWGCRKVLCWAIWHAMSPAERADQHSPSIGLLEHWRTQTLLGQATWQLHCMARWYRLPGYIVLYLVHRRRL